MGGAGGKPRRKFGTSLLLNPLGRTEFNFCFLYGCTNCRLSLASSRCGLLTGGGFLVQAQFNGKIQVTEETIYLNFRAARVQFAGSAPILAT